MKNTYLISIIFILALQTTGTAQDYYYGNGRKIPLIEAIDRLVLQIGETDSNIVRGKLHGIEIAAIKSLKPNRGIFQFVPPTSRAMDQIYAAMQTRFSIQRRIPAYYRMNTSNERIEFIMFDEFVVKFGEYVTAQEIDSLNADHQVEIIKSNEWHEYLLRVTESAPHNALEMANIYYQDQRTIWSKPNFIAPIRPLQIDDTYFDEQWYLHSTASNPGTVDMDIDALEAWNITTGNSSIIVAIMDTGVENHEDLSSSRFVSGYNAKSGPGSGAPGPVYNKHGQCVAGIVAAAHNGIGVRGVAGNAKIMPIKVLFRTPNVPDPTDEEIADSFDWAWYHGADIINGSWGTIQMTFYGKMMSPKR